jgi:hypothetical protein
MPKSNQMLTWEKKHDICDHDFKKDFSHYTSFDAMEKEPYFYCPECHTRWYKNKIWNPQEWDNWIND